MSQLGDRIAQFRKMATDDPDNELGHFRLGQLLLEDHQPDAAEASFRRTLELSPQFSKVFQLLAQAQIAAGRRDDAVRSLREGYHVADMRGDKMPRDEMGRMLGELGEPVPTPAATPAKPVAAAGDFPCQRPNCVVGGMGKKLDKRPLPDELGQRIADTVCADCWESWHKDYSIKVINEMRLDLSTEAGQEEYDRHMRGFFGFEGG